MEPTRQCPQDGDENQHYFGSQQTVVGEKGYRTVRSTKGISSGVLYFEIRINELYKNILLQDTNNLKVSAVRVGFSRERAGIDVPVGFDEYGYSYCSKDGNKYHNQILQTYGEGYTIHDIIGCYLQLPIMKNLSSNSIFYEHSIVPKSHIIFFKNGKCQDIAFTDIPGGIYYPTISLYMYSSVTINFGPIFTPIISSIIPDGLRIEYREKFFPPFLISDQQDIYSILEKCIEWKAVCNNSNNRYNNNNHYVLLHKKSSLESTNNNRTLSLSCYKYWNIQIESNDTIPLSLLRYENLKKKVPDTYKNETIDQIITNLQQICNTFSDTVRIHFYKESLDTPILLSQFNTTIAQCSGNICLLSDIPQLVSIYTIK